ncbi:MAG: hypothetical protein M3535_00605 [Actinomycetota bacterium]|nr:hypothetical protein [Actinomycetota bacterium]
MALNLDSLIRLLEEEPEQRRALRRALLGDEPDLAGALASLTQRVEALAEAQRRTEQQVAALAEAQRRTEESASTP